MNFEEFQKSKDTIRAGWPSDRVISEERNKIVIQCENGAFLKWGRIEMSPEMVAASPIAAKMMHEKVMLQFTEDLTKPHFENISNCLAGKEQPKEGKMKEAFAEFSKRVQLGAVFTR